MCCWYHHGLRFRFRVTAFMLGRHLRSCRELRVPGKGRGLT